MKYKVYYGDSKTQVPGYQWVMTNHKSWPKDTTEIEFSIDGYLLTYNITNLSDRTQYLYDNDLLGLGIFVEENPHWLKPGWRSKFARRVHPTRRCIRAYRLQSLSDTIDLSVIASNGAFSWSLRYIFDTAYNWEDPYVSSGTENIAIGIGRMHNSDDGSNQVSSFRPYNVTNYIETEVENTQG